MPELLKKRKIPNASLWLILFLVSSLVVIAAGNVILYVPLMLVLIARLGYLMAWKS